MLKKMCVCQQAWACVIWMFICKYSRRANTLDNMENYCICIDNIYNYSSNNKNSESTHREKMHVASMKITTAAYVMCIIYKYIHTSIHVYVYVCDCFGIHLHWLSGKNAKVVLLSYTHAYVCMPIRYSIFLFLSLSLSFFLKNISA